MRLDSIIVFPGEAETTLVTSAGSQPMAIREARDFDRFAGEMRTFTSAAVGIAAGLRLPPVADGVFYMCRSDVLDRSLAHEVERPRLLASHTVLVDVGRTYALQQAEELSLAAVVTSEEYFDWQDSRGQEGPTQFYGLKTVGRTLGASWQPIPIWEGRSYALLRDSRARSLTAFLAEYLIAYATVL
jgi:hypothetical protein